PFVTVGLQTEEYKRSVTQRGIRFMYNHTEDPEVSRRIRQRDAIGSNRLSVGMREALASQIEHLRAQPLIQRAKIGIADARMKLSIKDELPQPGLGAKGLGRRLAGSAD